MVLESNLIQRLKDENLMISFWDNGFDQVKPENCLEFTVHLMNDNHYKAYRFKAKKQLTYDWLIQAMNKKDNIKSVDWNSIFKKTVIADKFKRCYNTSYGFGIECIFSNNNEVKESISEFLKNKDIEFTNEYSEAGWVYRFKISKSKTNIDKILSIK